VTDLPCESSDRLEALCDLVACNAETVCMTLSNIICTLGLTVALVTCFSAMVTSAGGCKSAWHSAVALTGALAIVASAALATVALAALAFVALPALPGDVATEHMHVAVYYIFAQLMLPLQRQLT